MPRQTPNPNDRTRPTRALPEVRSGENIRARDWNAVVGAINKLIPPVGAPVQTSSGPPRRAPTIVGVETSARVFFVS